MEFFWCSFPAAIFRDGFFCFSRGWELLFFLELVELSGTGPLALDLACVCFETVVSLLKDSPDLFFFLHQLFLL